MSIDNYIITEITKKSIRPQIYVIEARVIVYSIFIQVMEVIHMYIEEAYCNSILLTFIILSIM